MLDDVTGHDRAGLSPEAEIPGLHWEANADKRRSPSSAARPNPALHVRLVPALRKAPDTMYKRIMPWVRTGRPRAYA